MTDHISRAEAIELMSGSNIEDHLDSVLTSEPRRYARAAQRVIWSVPAADVAPVRHGTWLPIVEANEDGSPYQAGVFCSECGHPDCVETNYCSYCGAYMAGGKKNAVN